MKALPGFAKINLLGESAISDAVGHGLRNALRRIDLPLLVALLVASACGLMVLYSAGGKNLDLLLRQGFRLGLGFAVMLVMAQVPPHYLRFWTPWAYLGGVLLLVAVLLVGDTAKGAQRWLDVGVRFQPAEIMRLAVPMMMAWFFADRPLPPRFWHVIVAAVITLLPFLLIAKQPDLGTAMLIFSSGVFALFLGGLSWKIILGVVAAVGAVAPLVFEFALHDYQRQRVLTFLNPETDPLGTGYHIIQSKIAIGSGGFYGKGWLNGSQTHLDFLPEGTTDFIFAVIAEEFGLLGLCLLLLLYFFIIARGLLMASRASDTYGRLLAGSLALTFFVYVFVNTGMVSGLLPVVGVPLPMISFGGTSLVTIMTGFGILMSVHAHRRLSSL